MTAQRSDSIRLSGKQLTLAAFDGTGMFDPADYGLSPVATSTASWRGWHGQLAVSEGLLVLERLTIGLSEEVVDAIRAGGGPQLDGVSPTPDDAGSDDQVFERLHLPIRFSGGLLAADAFILDLYEHMGFHPVWKYRRVLELVVRDGLVEGVRDVSDQVARARARMMRPDSPQDTDVEGWIKQTFSRAYPLDLQPPRGPARPG